MKLALILTALAMTGCAHNGSAYRNDADVEAAIRGYQHPTRVDPGVAAAIIANPMRPYLIDPNITSQPVYRPQVPRVQSCILQRVGNLYQRVCY